MRSAALLLVVLLVSGVSSSIGRAAPAATPDASDIPGVYECQGTGADGKPYRGAVIIEPDGSRFVVRWIIASELTAIGVGVREANMLAVSFFGPDSGGVVLYRIDGQKLIGHWSAPLAAGQVFEETLTRMADPPASSPTNPSVPEAAPRPRPSRARPLGPGSPI